MGIYRTKGVCAREIRYEVADGVIGEVEFVGGCHGNAQGISQLVREMKVEDDIHRLSGIKCGGKSTSCPDQLAQALTEVKE